MTTIEKLPAKFRRDSRAAANRGEHKLAYQLEVAAQEVEQAEKPEPTTLEDKTVELSEVLAWADGIRGALGSEHASKVEDREARVAEAIREAHPLEPPARDGEAAGHAWPGADEALSMTEEAVNEQINTIDSRSAEPQKVAELLREVENKLLCAANFIDVWDREKARELYALMAEGSAWSEVCRLMRAERAVPSPVGEVLEELQKARGLFPGWPCDPIHAAQIVQEEAGELGRAVLQIAYEKGKATPSDARREAVQTAAMAIRFLEHFAAYSKAPAELVYYRES